MGKRVSTEPPGPLQRPAAPPPPPPAPSTTRKPDPARICANCTHLLKGGQLDAWVCNRPIGEIDLVTGRDKGLRGTCKAEREMTYPDACGPDGKFWEAAK